MMWVFDLKQTGDLHRVQGIKIECQFHSIFVVKRLSKFVVMDKRNCFEQIVTQHTTKQCRNQLHVKYELALLFEAIGVLNLSN